MDILTEIQQAIAKFDPELFKNEEGEEEEKSVTSDDYQKAVDSAVDPEDLNFSMDPLDDDDDDSDEVEKFEIPQRDFDEQNLEVGDFVEKVAHKGRKGEILAIGELIEVQWQEDLTTLEYPEELIKADENPEEEDVRSIETIPPIPLEKNS